MVHNLMNRSIRGEYTVATTLNYMIGKHVRLHRHDTVFDIRPGRLDQRLLCTIAATQHRVRPAFWKESRTHVTKKRLHPSRACLLFPQEEKRRSEHRHYGMMSPYQVCTSSRIAAFRLSIASDTVYEEICAVLCRLVLDVLYWWIRASPGQNMHALA